MDCLGPRIIWRTVATGVGALVLGMATTAASAAQPDVVSIAVFADHYVVAGRSFDDLDVLESALAAVPDKPIRLDRCGLETARALRAAAHRFRDRPIEMRTPSAGDLQCADSVPTMRRVAESTRPLPLGIDDAAVERYWDSITP